MDISNVRIKEHFGLVTNDTNTTQFNFLISPPKNHESIQKQDIVCLDHPIYGEVCQVLGEVTEVTSYEEVAGSSVRDRIGKLLATTKVIGYVDLRNEKKPLKSLLIPPNPGSRVYMPYVGFLEDVLNRGTDGAAYSEKLYLGKTEITASTSEADHQQLDYYLNMADLTGKHTLISAVDGSGKTHMAAALIEELASRSSHPIVVIDPNNEYGTIRMTNKNSQFNNQIATINVNSSKNEQEDITKKIKQSQITTIIAEILSLSEKKGYYAKILLSLTKGRREKKIPPFLLVIENAEDIESQVIQEVLMTDGISTMLITSHPNSLGGKVLSQTQTQIIGKTTSSENSIYLQNVISRNDGLLPDLGVGEWIINGLNVNRSTIITAKEHA